MGFLKSIKKSLSHNHTLKFLADPFKPVEKIVSAAHDDVKSVVSYGGKVGNSLVDDVGTISGGLSTGLSTISLPLIVGGVVVVVMMMNKR